MYLVTFEQTIKQNQREVKYALRKNHSSSYLPSFILLMNLQHEEERGKGLNDPETTFLILIFIQYHYYHTDVLSE